MSYQRAITDPDVAKALAHPLRMRLLGLLEDRTASPTELADITGASLPRVSYHVRRLAGAGLIELVRTKQRRGAVEHYYRAVHQALAPAEPWGPLPSVVTSAMLGEALAQARDDVNAAIEHGGFARPEVQLTRIPMTLDEDGWQQLAARLAALASDLRAIAAASEARLQEGADGVVDATALLMLFERKASDLPQPAAPASAGHGPRRKKRATATH